MKGICKRIHVALFAAALALGLASTEARAQDRTVSGTVRNAEDGLGLAGVNIVVKGTTTGTLTDRDGNYSLVVPSLSDTLVFSLIGFQTQETPISGRTTVDVALSPLAIMLKELVVIGYGAVQKSDLTGSVSSVTPDQFNAGIQSSVDGMIQARVPGVKITQSTAEPGGGSSVRIRGATSITAGNEPLYVIDGQPIDNLPAIPGSPIVDERTARNPLKTLNPGEIESIEILKDASAAAIYGSRGANGVVLITTKRGRPGPLRIEYNSSASIQHVANKLDFMNATEYMTFANALRADQGQGPLFTQEEIAAAGEGTDWQDEILRTAPAQNHHLSFSGGSANTTYHTSFNYFDQEGVIRSSGTKRYSGRLNIDHSINKFDFGVNLSTSVAEDDFVPNGVGINATAGVVATAHQMDPTMPVRTPEGAFSESGNLDIENPVALAESIVDEAETNRTIGNVFGEYKISSDLSAKLLFGSDRHSSRRDGYINKVTKRGQSANSTASVSSFERNNYLVEATLNYDRAIRENHSLNAVAGYTYQAFYARGVFAGAADFATDNFSTDNLSAGNREKYAVGTSQFRHQLLSYLGRINYSAYGKYLLTTSFRIDGSSRFGEHNRYGYFPSLALGWRLSNEPFLADQSIISDLKLRASYGITGNQAIGNYNSLVLLGTVGDAVFDGQRFVGIAPIQLGNPNLKWETTAQLNVGVDFGFFDDRVTGSMDYFVKNTSDLLLSLPIPRTTGFSTSLQNVGEIRNRGFEFVVGTRNFVGDFNWTSTFSLATLENKVVSLGELPFILQGGLRFLSDLTILKEGEPMNSYFGYKTDGVFQSQAEIDGSAQPGAQPGDIRFVDVNGDGTINPDDRTILGDPYPDVEIGFNNNLRYKGFGLDVFVEGSFGHQLLNFTRIDSETPIEFLRNRQTYVLDRWTPENPTSENPSFVRMDVSRAVNDRVIEDASFLRLKSVTLRYQLPGASVRRIGVNAASLYISAQNLLTLTDYTGYDPDVSSLGDSNIRLDYNAYPLARTYTLGIKLTL